MEMGLLFRNLLVQSQQGESVPQVHDQ